MRVLPLLAALAAMSLLAGGAAGGDGLVWRTSKEGGFSVKLPADWRYRDATYPSDHSTEYWTDPGNRHSFLKVQVSACAGCVQPTSCILRGTGCGPAPEQVVPATTLSTKNLDPWRLRFVARTAGTSYLDRGLVAIVHRGKEIVGFALVESFLPASKVQLADAILASYRG